MGKILITAVITAAIFACASPVSAATQTNTFKKAGYRVSFDAAAKVEKSTVSTMQAVYTKSGDDGWSITVAKDNYYTDTIDAYKQKGWAAFVKEYTKDIEEPPSLMLLSDDTVTAFRPWFRNGYFGAWLTLSSKNPITGATTTKQRYLVSKDRMTFYEVTGSGEDDAAFVGVFRNFINSFVITAPDVRRVTDRHVRFTALYPGSWWVTQSTAFDPRTKVDTVITTDGQTDAYYQVSMQRVVSPKEGDAELRSALKQGWSKFIAAALADRKEQHKFYAAALGNGADFRLGASQAYGLRGYRAAIVFAHESVIGNPERHAIIWVTKDGKNVYEIDGSWIGVKKNMTLPSPFTKDFRMIAQSFRII